MSRRRAVGAAVALVAGGYLAWVASWRPFETPPGSAGDGYQRVAGVVHVHTTASDGGGSPEQVVAAARAAALDFVAITDHNLLDAKSVEGRSDGLLVIVGVEVSSTQGHVLGLGVSDPSFRFSGDGRDALADIRELGGVAIAAHPTSPRVDFRWTGWSLPGPWGIELFNGDSQWREAGYPRLLRMLALYGLNRRYALLASLTSPAAALERWDALLAERDVAGIGGADAHQRMVLRKDFAVRFPSYASIFTLFRNYVLLPEPLSGRFDEDSRAVVAALAAGRAYVALDALAPAAQFSFTAETREGRFTMGDTVPLAAGLRLRAGGALPAATRLRLLRSGVTLVESGAPLDFAVTEEGAYRVEARLPGWDVPWVLSNPIYVFDAPAAARRRERAAWPAEPAPPEAVELIDAFEGTTSFERGVDSASSLADPFVVPDGSGTGRAAKLEFRIGQPTATHPDVYAALVDRTPRDLSEYAGLVFRLRGDGSYRIWVQVRDENQASRDEGTEWWFASIKATAEWRRVAVPFANLRSINPKTDGRLDLDRVRALVFVLDKGSVKPGTAGTIWLDDVGVF